MSRPKKTSFNHNLKTHLLLKSTKLAFRGIWLTLKGTAWSCIGVGWVSVWVALLPYRFLRYIARFRWGRTFIMGWCLVAFFYIAGLGVKMYTYERAARVSAERQVQLLGQKLNHENEVRVVLAAKLDEKQEDRGRHISPQSKQYIIDLVHKIFGPQAETALKVFNCESGLSPFNINDKNAPGLGIDGGVAQINERWHKVRFEKMFGVPYEVGVFNPELNLKYAKFLQENSGWGAWVCSRILKV